MTLFFPSALDKTDSVIELLFTMLSVDNVLKILGAALLEEKIIFSSKSYRNMTTAIRGTLQLMAPFDYPFVVIPILPRLLLEFVTAPTPFLIGVSAHFISEAEIDTTTTIIVYLDRNEISMPDSVCIPLLPRLETNLLKSGLQVLLSANLKQGLGDFAFTSTISLQEAMVTVTEQLEVYFRNIYIYIYIYIYMHIIHIYSHVPCIYYT